MLLNHEKNTCISCLRNTSNQRIIAAKNVIQMCEPNFRIYEMKRVKSCKILWLIRWKLHGWNWNTDRHLGNIVIQLVVVYRRGKEVHSKFISHVCVCSIILWLTTSTSFMTTMTHRNDYDCDTGGVTSYMCTLPH